MPVITNIDDLKRIYQRRVPQMFYDYAESGSWSEQTFRDNVTDFDQLRANVVELIGTTAPVEGEDGPEIEIDTDYNLRYEYVIRSITAVSGYKQGNEVVKLIEKIKFAKPRR